MKYEDGGREIMGTTLSSIHIFSSVAPADCGLAFRSFSQNWQTCIEDFSETQPNAVYAVARNVSKHTDAPVLFFSVFDSEAIWFTFFLGGNVLSKYTDDGYISGRGLSKIPSLIGRNDTLRKRLSPVLNCSDTDLKIQMLQEYLGVCLLFSPELLEESDALLQERDDALFRQYQQEEKRLTGKASPIELKLLAEYPGKLFFDTFGNHDTVKPHYFLWGYTEPNLTAQAHELTPVCFTGTCLNPVSRSEFMQNRITRTYQDSRFIIHYGTSCSVTFSEECPAVYRGKTMPLPSGFFPIGFLKAGEILLQGKHRIFIADRSMKVIAKHSIKGDVADVIDDCLLTTSGDSFCGYCYEPKAKIYVYQLLKKEKQ